MSNYIVLNILIMTCSCEQFKFYKGDQHQVFSSLKILIVDGDGESTNTTSNVVYYEVFPNVS